MKKRINKSLLLLLGILVFILSYAFDGQVNIFFKSLKSPVFDFFLSTITNFGLVIVILIIPSIIFYGKNKKLVYLAWTTFIASFVLAFAIKLIVLRQRPTEALTYPFTHIIDYSFPSMHAMAVFSLLPILIKHLPKQKYFFVVFAFLVAFSRIYLGFHFLSDVVFGALIGYFIGDFLLNLYEKRKNK